MLPTEQLQLPLSGEYRCETCYCEVPVESSQKSRERYDQHVLCFKHQLLYKKFQIRIRRHGRKSHQIAGA
jgi:hypothetical protein